MNVLAPNTVLAPEGQPRVPPRNYIACHQANSFDVMIRISTITAIYTNAEGHAGIVTESGYDWHLTESLDEVLLMISAAQGGSVSSTPASGISEHKQDREPDPQNKSKHEDHAWPPPPDDMREGDLPKDPNHDPKNDTWERDPGNKNER